MTDDTITSADVTIVNTYGRALPVYDDGSGQLWIYRTSQGIDGVVRADTYEDAYECVLDEILSPIDQEDVPDAYGAWDRLHEYLLHKGNDDTVEMRQFCSEWANWHFEMRACREEWGMVEGYAYQPNATGTGIVGIDLNGERLEVLTHELCKELDLTIRPAAA